MVISCRILLRMRNVSDKIFRENQTHILCTTFFFPENPAVDKVQKYVRARQTTGEIKYGVCALHAG